MKSFADKFPLSDEVTIREIFKFVRNHLKVKDLKFEFIERELLLATRKTKLQVLIKELFSKLKHQPNERREHRPVDKEITNNAKKLSKGQVKNILTKKRQDLIKSSNHRLKVESPREN